MWDVNNLDRGCRNCSQCTILTVCTTKIFQPFSKLFIQSIFYLQISGLSKKDSSGNKEFLDNMKWHKIWNGFAVIHSLVRVGRFLSKLPPWTILPSRGIFNYKGLDIKLAQCWLFQHIGYDFLYTARFSVNLSFPCSFLRKIQKPPKTRQNYPIWQYSK